MLSFQEEIIHHLETTPKFRERKYRGHLIATLALKATGLGTKWSNGDKLSIQELCEFATKFDSYRHAWTDVLNSKQFEHLQGSDYEDKEKLMQEKMLALGYTPGYKHDQQIIRKNKE